MSGNDETLAQREDIERAVNELRNYAVTLTWWGRLFFDNELYAALHEYPASNPHIICIAHNKTWFWQRWFIWPLDTFLNSPAIYSFEELALSEGVNAVINHYQSLSNVLSETATVTNSTPHSTSSLSINLPGGLNTNPSHNSSEDSFVRMLRSPMCAPQGFLHRPTGSPKSIDTNSDFDPISDISDITSTDSKQTPPHMTTPEDQEDAIPVVRPPLLTPRVLGATYYANLDIEDPDRKYLDRLDELYPIPILP